MSEESVVKHFHDYGGHRCKRGHSFRITFINLKNGLAWLKICRRCSHQESSSGAYESNGRFVRSRSESIEKTKEPDQTDRSNIEHE